MGLNGSKNPIFMRAYYLNGPNSYLFLFRFKIFELKYKIINFCE